MFDYKKDKIKYFLVFIFIVSIILCNKVYSQSISDLKNKIQQVTENKKQLEEEIAKYESQLKDVSSQANSLSNAIKTLDTTIKKNSTDIKLTENNIKKTELEIDKLSISIDNSVDKIDQNIKVIVDLINQESKNDGSTFIEKLILYKDLSDFWNEIDSINKIQTKIREKVSETKEVKKGLETDKDEAIQKRKQLLTYKSELQDKKKILDINKKEKNDLLLSTKNQETNYKNILVTKKAMQDALEKELNQFESELKIAIDPKSIPSEKRGVLSWPITDVFITQKFGYTDFSKTAYAAGQHNGVDFRASIGTNIMTTLSGVVEGVGDTDKVCPGASYGKWILIKHNNGLSTIYGHLSLIKVKKGDVVVTGDTIGYSGNTGYSTGPHLHLGLYASQGVKIMDLKSKVCNGTYTLPVADIKAYLDPLKYLPKY